MKNLDKKILCILLLIFTGFARSPSEAKSVLKVQPRILIFGKTIRPPHAPIIPIAGRAISHLLSENGFQATFIEDSDQFDHTQFSDYRALVLLDVSEGVISSKTKRSIETFFDHGGGIVAIHSSIAAGKDWPWFQKLVGVSFLDHAKVQLGTIKLSEVTHPANAHLPPSWVQSDEWYNFSNQIILPIIVLAQADEKTFQGGKMGVSHPITWASEQGDGRFWYTGLGHPAELYTDSNDVFSKMLLRAVIWVSKQNNL